MKELKFRAWDKLDKEFVSNIDCLLDISVTERVFVLDDENGELVIEQYTGLKDKNGKEIYEGDIVEYDWYITSNKTVYRTKEQVVFDDMGARLGNDRIRNCSNVEVIGNIHENHDLLEKK